MILFLISNLIFLASFVWLVMTGASAPIWAAWIGAWFAADYAVMWLSGYEPPSWAWGAILAILALLWLGISFGLGVVA